MKLGLLNRPITYSFGERRTFLKTRFQSVRNPPFGNVTPPGSTTVFSVFPGRLWSLSRSNFSTLVRCSNLSGCSEVE
ncbi:hypothetical protein AX14_007447 [Amanita brunnescens Koide BX004]|nr:hypothetical protein AX14_007447 [Amanita brunnescens Koide BX004]